MTPRVRLVIAEDSKVQRELLKQLVSKDPAIELVGEATDGVEAVEAAKRLQPDVITMDVHMPRLGGLEAIDRIMEVAPSRILVVCSVGDDAQVDLSFRAVAAGALEVIAKPRVDKPSEVSAWGKLLCESIRLMAEIPVVRRRRSVFRSELASTEARVDAVGVVASTGGPPALAILLGALSADFPVPIFIAQHMAPGFCPGLIRWLASVTSLKVGVAKHGVRATAGNVYLPPDGHDLIVDRRGDIQLVQATSVHCPSANQLLSSLAAAYGERACGVVLTGMGEDGAEGVRAIRSAGGIALAQDEASCVVFGMPRAAIAAGAVTVLMAQLHSTLRELCVRDRKAGAPR